MWVVKLERKDGVTALLAEFEDEETARSYFDSMWESLKPGEGLELFSCKVEKVVVRGNA